MYKVYKISTEYPAAAGSAQARPKPRAARSRANQCAALGLGLSGCRLVHDGRHLLEGLAEHKVVPTFLQTAPSETIFTS